MAAIRRLTFSEPRRCKKESSVSVKILCSFSGGSSSDSVLMTHKKNFLQKRSSSAPLSWLRSQTVVLAIQFQDSRLRFYLIRFSPDGATVSSPLPPSPPLCSIIAYGSRSKDFLTRHRPTERYRGEHTEKKRGALAQSASLGHPSCCHPSLAFASLQSAPLSSRSKGYFLL